jgi:hypothetical protein
MIKAGDTVELVSTNKLPNEDWNYIKLELPQPKEGDRFKVISITVGNYLELEGLDYRHPIDKFKKV